MNLQNGHLSEVMIQGGKEMMAGRWWGTLERLDVQDVLDQSYSRLSCNPVSECPLTYQSELIDASEDWGERF
jgi:hypothetical protein